MWCVSEPVELHYNNEVKKRKMKVKVQEMKEAVDELGLPVKTMRLSEDGEITYTMETNQKH